MSSHTATTLAFVRTSAGVVRVDVDDDLPEGVDDSELQRLVAGGVVVETAEEPAPQAPVPAPPAGAKGATKGAKRS